MKSSLLRGFVEGMTMGLLAWALGFWSGWGARGRLRASRGPEGVSRG